MSKPQLPEATELILRLGDHTTVSTFAPGTKPWEDPYFPCLKPQAAGHKVGRRAGGLVGAWQAWREAPAGGRLAGRAPEWGPSCPAQATVLSPFPGGSQGAGISTKASFAPPELISSPVPFSAEAGVLRVASHFTAGPVIVTVGFPAIPPGGHSFPSASLLRSLPPLSSPLHRCPPPLWTSWPPWTCSSFCSSVSPGSPSQPHALHCS